MKDGTARLVPSMEFTHPAAREAQEAWRERQAIQGPGGRPRAIKRTASTAVLSIYVGTTPIPNMRFDAVIRGPADLASGRTLCMIAGGFAFQSAHIRHRLLPDIYPRPWTADYDIARERDGNPDPQAAFFAMLRKVLTPSWHPGPLVARAQPGQPKPGGTRCGANQPSAGVEGQASGKWCDPDRGDRRHSTEGCAWPGI
jgi:hypothetical protein